MESFPIFFRVRAITFITVMMFSFLWLVLLCVEMFIRWTVSDQISQSLMILFVITNTITLIMLPILIIVQFRVYLDAARLLLLLVLQVGSAISGTAFSHRIQCPDQTLDDIGVCQLINVYTMIACWIIPAILIVYSTYFAILIYLQSRIPVVVDSPHQRRSSDDPEAGSANSLSLWREKIRDIVRAQSPSTPTSAIPRSFILPNMVHGQLSLPQLSSSASTSTGTPSLLHTGQQLPSLRPPMPSRHQSLPAFRHHRQVSIPHPIANDGSATQPQTPQSDSQSIPSPVIFRNHFSGSPPGIADAPSLGELSGRSKHLSMMPPLSRGIQNDGECPANPRRARLSKPHPAHFL